MTMAFRWWLITYSLTFMSVPSFADHFGGPSSDSTSNGTSSEAPASEYGYRGYGEFQTFQFKNCAPTIGTPGDTKSSVAPLMKMVRENTPVDNSVRQFQFLMNDNAVPNPNVASEYVLDMREKLVLGPTMTIWRGFAKVTDMQTRRETYVPVQMFESPGNPPLRRFALYKSVGPRYGAGFVGYPSGSQGSTYQISVFDNRGNYAAILADAEAQTNRKLYQTQKTCRASRSTVLGIAKHSHINTADDPTVPANVDIDELPFYKEGRPQNQFVSRLNDRAEQVRLAQALGAEDAYISPAIRNFISELQTGNYQTNADWVLRQYLFSPVFHRN